MAVMGGVVLPTVGTVVAEYTEPSSPTLAGVFFTVVLVAALALAAGALLKMAVTLFAHVGLLDGETRLPYDAATVWGLALALGYMLVYQRDFPETRVVLLFAAGTVVTWPFLQLAVRQFGWVRLDVDGMALLRRHVVKGSVGVLALAVVLFSALNPALRWLVVGMAGAIVVGFLVTGGSHILRRYTPSTTGAVLPSHYAGMIQRTSATSHTDCPECGADNDPRATVCGDCSATLATSGGSDREKNLNAHLKR